MTPKNAFYILELSPDASNVETERQARKLLGLLELGVESARTYRCPVGTFARDATMVREALVALRDQKRRAREGTLAKVLLGEKEADVQQDAQDAPLRDAFLAAGYRGI